MRAIIDISPLKSGHQYRGIGVYTKLLYKALKQVDTENEYVLTTKSGLAEADVVHYPFFDFFFLSLPVRKPKPTVVTIHDTIPLIYRKQYPPGIKGKFKLMLQKQRLSGVKAIITDSVQSAADIHTYLKVPQEKIFPIHLAAHPQFAPQKKNVIQKVLKKYAINQPYLLYVGDINYNKNLPALIQAYAGTDRSHDLVLVSRALAKMIPEAEEIRHLIQQLELEDRVHLLSDVPNHPLDQITALYSGADWYIQPSLYEGFGLPVLEAWACGTPVISSTGGSLKEVIGKAALSFDPGELMNMTRSIAQAVKMSKPERQEWIKKGMRRNKEFNWEKTAKETIEVYRKVLS